uniref:Uncharacterized protein n=1 Tax=Pararge aegeria TaxID=116150 RepID=S4PZ45_9NEOP
MNNYMFVSSLAYQRRHYTTGTCSEIFSFYLSRSDSKCPANRFFPKLYYFFNFISIYFNFHFFFYFTRQKH